MTNIDTLMKRCQTGCGGPGALNNANDLLAECYGALGALRDDAERYKYLRDVAWETGSLIFYAERYGPEDWDAHIDAARKAAP